MVAGLLRKHAREKAPGLSLSRDAARALFACLWPLNVRELERALMRAILVNEGGKIRRTDLFDPAEPSPEAVPQPARVAVSKDLAERRAQIVAALRKHRGSKTAAGRELGVDRVQIHRWIKSYDIQAREYEDSR
jgi:two-component system response regulator AtoC